MTFIISWHLLWIAIVFVSCLQAQTFDLIGAPERSTSYPSNPGEFVNAKKPENHTFCVPLTPGLVGQTLEVVIQGTGTGGDQFQPMVWQTARDIPFRQLPLSFTLAS